jgi:hypothetical protein
MTTFRPQVCIYLQLQTKFKDKSLCVEQNARSADEIKWPEQRTGRHCGFEPTEDFQVMPHLSVLACWKYDDKAITTAECRRTRFFEQAG